MGVFVFVTGHEQLVARQERGGILKSRLNLATYSYLTSEHVDVTPIAAQSPAFREAGFSNCAQLTSYPNAKNEDMRSRTPSR